MMPLITEPRNLRRLYACSEQNACIYPPLTRRASSTGFTGFGGFPTRLIGGTFFDPSMVPEVAAGRWWDPQFFTGLGTAAFRWTEMNATAPEFDGLQTVLARQPSVITTRGYSQWRFTAAAGSAVTTVSTAGPMGWTGATLVAGWFQFPNAALGTNQLVRQSVSGVNRRILASLVGSSAPVPNRFSTFDAAGTAFEWRWGPTNWGMNTGWNYYEYLYYPSTRLEFWLNRRFKTALTTAFVPAALNDPVSCAISFASLNATTGNTDNTDVGLIYYCNGIPNDTYRDLLYGYKAPADPFAYEDLLAA